MLTLTGWEPLEERSLSQLIKSIYEIRSHIMSDTFTRSSFCVGPNVKPLTAGPIIFLFLRYYGWKTLPRVFKAWWMFPLAVTVASGKWQTTFEPEEEKVGILLPLGDKLHSGKQLAPELMQTCVEPQRIALICHSPHMELEQINCVFSQRTWLWIPWKQEYWISDALALISWRMVWHAGYCLGIHQAHRSSYRLSLAIR